jgi:hypothetical protein
MFDPIVTIYRHYRDTQEPNHRKLSFALSRIRDGQQRAAVEAIRAATTEAERKERKSNLPGVCFSGKFGPRLDESLQKHSGLIVLDFDGTGLDFRKILIASPYTYACWLSPSGNGFKALIRITDGTRHKEHFAHIRKHLWPTADPSGVNVSRLCFESYDPDLYVNPGAQIYSKVLEQVTLSYTERKAPEGSDFDRIVKWLDRKGDAYQSGQRNTFIFKAAAACCRFGIGRAEAELDILGQWPPSTDFTAGEALKAIASAYKRTTFGTATFEDNQLVSRTGEKEIDLGTFDPGRVDDVIYARDVVEGGLSLKNEGYKKAEPWGGEEPMDFRLKRGELTCLSGYGNVGKSAFATWMQVCKSLLDGTRWAVFGPENYPADEYYHEVVEMLEGGALGPQSSMTLSDAQYRARMDWVDKHFFYCYPLTDDHTLELILERFLQLIMMEGVTGVMIDPWNQLEHDYAAVNGRDDRLLEKMLKRCKRFATENNVFFFILNHPTNPELPKGQTNYRCPEYSDLAGGAMWPNKCDNVLVYHRPEFLSNPDATLCELHKKKTKKPRVVGKRGRVELDFDYRRRRFLFGDVDPLSNLLRANDKKQ